MPALFVDLFARELGRCFGIYPVLLVRDVDGARNMTAANRADIFANELLGVRASTICTFGSFSRATTSLVVTATVGLISSLIATGGSCDAPRLTARPVAAQSSTPS